MARGKNNRRRASIDGPAPSCAGLHRRCGSNPQDPLASSNNPNTLLGNSQKEVEDAIEFHWKNLSMELKQFLLKCPQELSLRKFVDYWTHPSRIENTNPNIAASVCGCSWFLALNYMTIGKVVEARALVLNGCFLQQCYNKPIEEIAEAAQSTSGEHFRTKLPFFTDGLLAISTPERMHNFLKKKVTSDYQRRMSFATQTSQSKRKVAEYVDQISSDWGSGESTTTQRQKNEARRRASLDALPADSFIEIKLVDSRSKEETTMRYGLSMPLKTLFKKYAEDRDLSLRQLRFSYEGRTLFLSSAGNKSPKDLGMENLDSIFVIDNAALKREELESSSSSSDESKENARPMPLNSKSSKKPRKRRPCRRASWAGPEILGEEERAKLRHSKQLSKVFTEAAPQFEQIRQKLNALNLTNTPPKIKQRKRIPVAIAPLPFVDNPSTDGVGGKAGVPFYAVHVGAAENLYTTMKHSLHAGRKAVSIDLHGMTREEALAALDAKLPKWVDTAMKGEHPWVVPATIICGGGNQILSEAVEGWIRGNENVAKAPKRKFSRRRTVG